MRRLFFALWPDRTAAERLAAECLACLAGLDAGPVAEPDLHLTLCFLGPLDEAREALVVRQAGGIAAMGFDLQLDTFEYWSASQVLVLAPSSIPGAAFELAGCLRALARDCGVLVEQVPWRPHVTLARRVPPAAGARARGPGAGGHELAFRFAAQHFFLAQSESGEPRYRRLRQWPLRPPGIGSVPA